MPPASSFLTLLTSAINAANALFEWLLTYALHSTILIGGLLLLTATAAGKRFVAGHGSWLWRFALIGALVTATLQSASSAVPFGGTLRLDADAPRRTLVRMQVERNSRAGAGAVSGPQWLGASGERMTITSSIDVNPVWPLATLGAWLGVAAAMLAWFLVARARFMRTIGHRTSADHTLAGNALRYLLREGGITRRVRLTTSDRLTSPVALGSDEICLPSRALSELDPIRMESMLAHELAHLVRRDPSWLTLSRMIEALFFFQPLNIVARRRMQEAAEFASDAWASTKVARPLDLAHCLARVAEWTIAAPRLPVPAMAERRGAVLVRRVELLTTGRVTIERPPGRGMRLAAVGALIALVFLAPRVAVGAEKPHGRQPVSFGASPMGFIMLRSPGEGPVAAGAIGTPVRREAIVVRVTGQR